MRETMFSRRERNHDMTEYTTATREGKGGTTEVTVHPVSSAGVSATLVHAPADPYSTSHTHWLSCSLHNHEMQADAYAHGVHVTQDDATLYLDFRTVCAIVNAAINSDHYPLLAEGYKR